MAETTFTLRNSPHTYLQLQVSVQPASKPSNTPVDEITLLSYLNAAMTQYLGLTGAAIPIDILKVQESQGWVRLPREDEPAVVAALSQWTGRGNVTVRVLGRGSWLGGLSTNDGVDDRKLWSLEA